ncbi:hypothetical protein [Microbacterium sp.]|uniref:hypothetical protein n=1 Tax=Microbacterium sp. TaxID=51671 RepID=UPI003F707836
MSVEPDTRASESSAASPGDPGLWRLRWFRVLTILNSTIVVVSAIGAVVESQLRWSIDGWMFIAFPVVPALFALPLAWFVVLAFAVLFSALGTIVHPADKGARFLRALTVWGTIVLGAPIVLTALGTVMALVGDLVN